MAVYDGFPSIRLEGDASRALALIPDAKAMLYEVQNFKRLAGVDTFALSRRLDDDSTVYVLSAGDQHVLHIAVAPEVPERLNPEEFETYDDTPEPEFYSGLVFNGYLEERTRKDARGRDFTFFVCALFSPTPVCRDTHKELVGGRQEVTRLAVSPHAAFDELKNNSLTGIPVFSQYTKLRSSMYSGTMKKVAQVVMGLGRIRKEKLRGRGTPKAEDGYVDARYIRDVRDNGVQIRFDWRFARTHGITTGADGRLWLVEISNARGVIARLLPNFPMSRTDEFRASAEARGDSAMVFALDELGCLPTGEAFPALSAQVAEMVTSGDILRLMKPEDLQEFYRCSPYSSAMGWAFNERGNEAHNTAYYFGDDGFQRGVWYQVNITIGAVKEVRKPDEPVADGTANLRKNTEGFIYSPPAKGPARYVPIKFHEPMLPGLLSHSGVPSIEAAGLPIPKVDTPMFVAFVDDDLKVVKYYRNPKQDVFNNVDDPRFSGECLLAGSWTITETSGSRSFPDMMYSNDFDDRKVLQELTVVTQIDSKDLGYDPPKFSDFIQSPEAAYVWRERVFRSTTTVDRMGGEQVVSAVAIPQFSREAYYYATASRFNLNRSGSTAVRFDVVKDPNVGYAWRCFPRINAPPFPPDRPDCNTKVCRGEAPCSSGGAGFPKERRVVCTAYEPGGGGPWVAGAGSGGACHEFADSGSWLSICQVVDGFNQRGMDKTPSSTSWDLERDERASLFLISPGYGGPLSIPVTASQVFNHWMTPSPDPLSGDVQFIFAEHSAIGSDMLVFATNLSSYQGERRALGYAPDSINQKDGFPTFVGVNKP